MDIAIKKDFVALVELLKANSNKKVSSILELDAFIDIVAKQSGGGSVGSTVKKDEHGNVVAIFCYYHKQWEDVAVVPYGKKANSTSGLNTMCKQGVSNWTKQQRQAKIAKAELLDKVASGEVEASQLNDELAKIEAERVRILPYEADVEVLENDETEESVD